MQPLSPIPFPHTKILPCGIKRVELHFLNSPTATERLPITASLMQAIKGCLFQRSHDYDNILMWTACCVGFFVFLCCGDFLKPMMQSFSPNTHLYWLMWYFPTKEVVWPSISTLKHPRLTSSTKVEGISG